MKTYMAPVDLQKKWYVVDEMCIRDRHSPYDLTRGRITWRGKA